MARPMPLELPPRDPREELRKRLEEAQVKHTEALLDSYEAERQPVAERLLRTTDRAFMLIVADTPLAALFRTRIMARMAAIAMRRERIRQLVFRTISQIGIRYRTSPLSRALEGLPEQAPQPGDRFPWLRIRLREERRYKTSARLPNA